MGTDQQGGMSRREMMTGLGLGAGAGLVLAAGLPLTAAAGPVANHVPAWAPLPKDLGPTLPGLTYVGIDSSAFVNPSGTRYYQGGQSGDPANNELMAPLSLPVGSMVRQVNIAVQASDGDPITVTLRENEFAAAFDADPVSMVTITSTGQVGAVSTATMNVDPPLVIEHAATYQILVVAPAGTTVRGVTVGYTPPPVAAPPAPEGAGFVPFDGATPRVLDTRTTGDRLTFGEEITLNLGNPGVTGALFNLTVTETQNGGFVAAFAADVAYPGNSSVNYTATGQTVANGVVSGVAPDGTIKLRGGGPLGSCHVIVDRLGWFV